MAKIGKTSEDGSFKRPLSNGSPISDSQRGDWAGAGPVSSDSPAPGTLFWVTGLFEDYIDKNAPHFGVGYSGAFTIETATVEIKGNAFGECDHFDELSSECQKCGRKAGNNIRLLSGSGDGVYSGINYFAAKNYETDDDLNPELMASFYLFDDGNAHSNGIDARGWDSPQLFFFQHANNYRDLPGSIVGDVQAGPNGFWVGEATAHHGSNDALVNHWGSENTEYRVLVFFDTGKERVLEDSGDSESPPLVPRILLILKKDIADTIFGNAPGLTDVDWTKQPEKWGNMTVFASIGGGDNTLACLANDAIYWLKVLESHHSVPDPNHILSKKYQQQVLGLMLQGALLGSEQSRSLLRGLLQEPTYGPFDHEDISAALHSRGWKLTEDATSLVDSLR